MGRDVHVGVGGAWGSGRHAADGSTMLAVDCGYCVEEDVEDVEAACECDTKA